MMQFVVIIIFVYIEMWEKSTDGMLVNKVNLISASVIGKAVK